MKVLGIDTTRKCANIFLFDFDKEEKYILSMNENIKHSDGLLLHVEKVLSVNNMTLDDVDKFAVIVGPGSFTGIRVGISTIKGFNKVYKKGVISLTSFEVFAQDIKEGCLLTHSTMNSCYYASIKNSKVVDARVINKNDLKEYCDEKEVYILKEEQNILSLEYDNIGIIDDLKEKYYLALKKKLNEISEIVEPFYLQLSQAERNLYDK